MTVNKFISILVGCASAAFLSFDLHPDLGWPGIALAISAGALISIVSSWALAEPGSQTANELHYRPDIDGLRAVAILPVILFHARLGCPGGFVGVDVFFVISGFLITSLILSGMKDGSFSLLGFWERRVRRILPALALIVFSTLVAGWFVYLPRDYELLGHSVAAQSVLLSNFFFANHTGYFDPGSDTMPLLHTWSLAVEEQFYLLLPLLLIFLVRRKRLPVGGIILCSCAGLLQISILGADLGRPANFYLLPTRAWELLIGAFLAAMPAKRLAKRWLNEAVALLGLGLILYSVFCYTPQTLFPGLATIPPCLGAATIIFSGACAPTLVSRLLALRPVVFVGLISYSLYLWHWPLLVFTKYLSMQPQPWLERAGLLGISVILATVSWKFIEIPFRKRLWFPQRSHIFAVAGCSMLLLLALGGSLYLNHGVAARLPVYARDYTGKPFDDRFWISLPPDKIQLEQFVELGNQGTNQPIEILLWGDSHAMAIAPAIDELCRKYSVRGVQVTQSATAPVVGYTFNAKPHPNNNSSAGSEPVLDFIAKKRIKSVVLAARWSVYRPPDQVGGRLADTVRALTSSDVHVYVLKDVPAANFDVPRFVTLALLRNQDVSKLEISPAKYAADNQEYESILKKLSNLGATVLDPSQYFLNARGCYDFVRDHKLLYRDDNHLSFDGAHFLVPMLEPVFETSAKNVLRHP